MGQLTILPSRNLEKTGVEASSGARRQERGEVGQIWEKQEEMSDMRKETIEKMRFCGGQWLWSRRKLRGNTGMDCGGTLTLAPFR